MLTAALAAVSALLVAGAAHDLTRRRAAARARRRLAPDAPSPGPPARFVSALADADLPFRPEHAWLAWLGAVVAAAAGGLAVAGPPAAVVFLVVAGGAPAVVLRVLRGRADAGAERALPAALELVARSLRGGASFREALAEAAPPGRLGGDLRTVVAEAEAGSPLTAALGAWAERRPSRGVRLAVAALALGAESGGATARAVDGVAATLRANDAVAAEARALASQARISALVIALAPVAFTLLAAGADPRTTEFLLRTPVGLGCLAAGLALDAAAAVWMHRLTAVEP